MHIELLWLVPVISFAAFLFIVAYYAQKSAERKSGSSELHNEVARFNAGQDVGKLVRAERSDDRLQELEKAINMVAEVLARQQRSLQDMQKNKEEKPHENEINELKKKLRSVFKEYDIVLSENYALRAKLKQVTRQPQEKPARDAPAASAASAVDSFMTSSVSAPATTLPLYEDTRLINLASMDADDMSESSDLNP